MAKYPLTLLPLISVSHGHCQFPAPPGAMGEPEYGTPAEVITAWASQQAHWVHVQDADAANGNGDNHLAIAAARAARVQVAGSISSDHDLELALQANPARIVVESSDPDWTQRVVLAQGDMVAVAIDVRRPDLADVVGALDKAGVARYVAWDAPTTHHFWQHDDRHLLAELCEMTATPVMSLGGVNHLDDLHRLHELVPRGLDSIIIGDPLYNGGFTYSEALAASADRFDLFYWGPPQP